MSDSPEGPRRRAEIEEQLRAELESARAQYEGTRQFSLLAASLIRDAADAFDPDSDQLAQQLLARQAYATDRYARALNEFHEFIVRGTVPERLEELN